MEPQPGDTVPAPEYGRTAVRMVDAEWCPNGHRLAPGNVSRGWIPCRCAGTSGHHTWNCWTCHETVYAPPHDQNFVPYPNAADPRSRRGSGPG